MNTTVPVLRHTLIVAILGIAALAGCQRKAALSDVVQDKIPNILIGSSDLGFGPCEPTIAINPKNTNQVVAGAVLDRVYYSQDGGKTWKEQQLRSPYGVYGDPVVLADNNGNFFYAHLADPSGSGRLNKSWLDRIVIQKSTDGGITWDGNAFTGNRPPADQDKHWLAAAPDNGHLYVTWTEFDKYGSHKAEDHSRILFSRSTDGGLTWSEAFPINQQEGGCIDDDNTTEGATPAVGPNGELYVSWAYGEQIYFDRSLDDGDTWLDEDITVVDQPGGWNFDIPGISRCNGMPFTEADRSNGPYRGSIYINWSDQRNGPADTDVWLAYSRDGGEHWSAPVRVNNDPAGRQQFFTAMALDQSTGYIYIVFYDRRAYDDNRTDVYLAFSTDGGQSFTNRRISESPFTPTTDVFFGDYNDISAENGHVRPIWTRLENGKLSVWTAIVEVKR
ncbi:MAG: exo-alpha-sialidase [Phaeodactylibacter sp.]|nr:exo-alpha-sialidase [Phaeodactylibacter sp.]MCB9274818.1 exo-alpha-sialidase [Lewinellaceae bacterium]